MTTTDTGQKGEQLARRFCIRRGWRLLHTNWRAGRGEIDIIARDVDTTVFVEVKYRMSDTFGAPEESLTPHKQQMLRNTIAAYLSHYPTPLFRVDIIAISHKQGKPQLKHLKDVVLLPKE